MTKRRKPKTRCKSRWVRHGQFFCDLYQVPVAVVVCEKEFAFKYGKKRLPKTFHSQLDDTCRTMVPGGARTSMLQREDGATAIFLWFSPNPLLSMLAHESFHAADMILDLRGFKLCDQSDEAWAYLIGWFMRKIAFVVFGKDSL